MSQLMLKTADVFRASAVQYGNMVVAIVQSFTCELSSALTAELEQILASVVIGIDGVA